MSAILIALLKKVLLKIVINLLDNLYKKGVNRKYALIDEFVLKMQKEINSLNRNYKDLKIQTFASKMFEDQNI
ncbi:hypothetical protein [Mycoplasmopsis arginini]|uniref:hypothetical protein n=1 Tax=Mycoplasmopsis arginini TaxID=2094 RepID=UPI00249DBBDF|nr:hypothetical protein [Mycoplasmopsis arginini]MDI3348175.1 hypothetical protein [Mycoplasmopsis arginini]MDI3349134.1 hypothetical protein [Mycoplasmopsis arginini]MDI3351492.1 hypothetical protein [Mycoplasmopsis arginini]MDI3352065.1 hypothetical protein [Mycoplasmopsis arginini]